MNKYELNNKEKQLVLYGYEDFLKLTNLNQLKMMII